MGSRLGRGTVALYGSHSSASMRVLGLEDLTQNRVIAKDVKSCTHCCYVKCATLIVRVGGNVLAPKQVQLITMHMRTSRQRSCNPRVGCLLFVCCSEHKKVQLFNHHPFSWLIFLWKYRRLLLYFIN